MTFLGRLIRTLLVLLVVVFGPAAGFAAHGDWSEVSYSVVARQQNASVFCLAVTASAPPSTDEKLVFTGAAPAQTGNLRALDDVKTTEAAFAVLQSSIAPSTVELPPGSRKLEPGGAQVTAPKGYDVYQAPDGTRYYQDAKGNNYASMDDLPTPTGQFEGKYVSNPKHDSPGGSISPQPKNPEATIADSVPVGGNSNKRIAYDSANNEIVVYQYDPGIGAYHGYVPQQWTKMPQQERNALIRAGLFKPNGKPKT